MNKKSQMHDSLLNNDSFKQIQNTSRLSVVFQKNTLSLPEKINFSSNKN